MLYCNKPIYNTCSRTRCLRAGGKVAGDRAAGRDGGTKPEGHMREERCTWKGVKSIMNHKAGEGGGQEWH